MMDHSPSSDHDDDSKYVEELQQFVLQLLENPDKEPVASEIEVLQSIYGDTAIRLFHPGEGHGGGKLDPDTIRYQANLSFPPPYEDISIKVLVSLPPTYPASSSPRLQFLSRYIGAYAIDPSLFGSVIRTYMSSNGVEFVEDQVCVFDGLQNVLERCVAWYEEQLSLEKAGRLVREELKEASSSSTTRLESSKPEASEPDTDAQALAAEMPPGIVLHVAEPIHDRKSIFIGRACHISNPSEVPVILAHLVSDKRIARAAHPVINAWRCQVGNLLHQDNDDDGETAAGGRIAHLLQILFGLQDPSLIKFQGYIDGKWVDAKSGEKIAVTNPATNDELGSVPEMGLEETQEAIAAAAKAFPEWSRTTAKYRHDLLVKLFQLMQQHHEDLSRLITLENGKTLAEAKGENTYSASFIEWFAEEAVRTYGEQVPSAFPGTRNVVIKQPVGVVGILTPWNFPSAMITRKLGAALAAGCTAVIKPPPETPFSALALAELATRAGFPPGAINMVTTQKNVSAVGREMCESKIVKKITFTGSTPVAKLLYSLSSSTLKKISLEAGGNSPFIVFDDANIEEAVSAAIVCKFRGSGQTCVCANRIYVQSGVYAEFASRLAEKVAAFKVGNGLEADTTHGPLIHARAVEKVERHVNDAVEKGAQVLVGGKALPNSSFFIPTVLSDVPHDALINKEETFGPLAALTKFETEEEVIRLANDSDVGLAGYFFSRDVGRVWRVAEKLEVGMVGANTGLISQAAIPFGGVKESGLGREGGHGINEYLNEKLITFGGLGA
ncbi:hypothetical protein EST38_g26 [Candolleomyces aberdarensis]|uniref:succinate-semialdehyde dehydrogenase [NAD(P)(+)] n=1 Tax=Candolleomyces aberdarensis TaxID=2316362 RepID=A0A4Q2E2S3_9AGAR|nr:hypothetical protein EST38_g26 [Candolleomyces aberdarensis]